MRDGTGKLPTPDSHVDGENGAKIMVYSMKREFKERGTREKQKKKKKKKGLRNIFFLPHSTNLLCGLAGPGSIPVLGSKPKLVLTIEIYINQKRY